MSIILSITFIADKYYSSKLVGNHIYTVGVLTEQVSGYKFHGFYYQYYYENKEYKGQITSNSNKNYYLGKRYIIKFQKDDPENSVFMTDYIINNDSIKMGDTINRSLFKLD